MTLENKPQGFSVLKGPFRLLNPPGAFPALDMEGFADMLLFKLVGAVCVPQKEFSHKYVHLGPADIIQIITLQK